MSRAPVAQVLPGARAGGAGSRRALLPIVVLAGCLVAGCDGGETEKRLPAAEAWSAPEPAASQSTTAAGGGNPHGAAMGGNPHGAMGGGDPHAGLNLGGADPHAGLNLGGGDPHAGLDMGGADPHAGLDMGNPGGLAAPDPNRPIDPNNFLRGRIDVASDVAKASKIEPGAVLFLSVRPIEPVTGTIIGQPLAVDRFEIGKLPLEFALTDADSMVAGTKLAGDVEIYARIDGDGDAISKEPGDIEGSVRARVPAKGLELTLDTLLR